MQELAIVRNLMEDVAHKETYSLHDTGFYLCAFQKYKGIGKRPCKYVPYSSYEPPLPRLSAAASIELAKQLAVEAHFSTPETMELLRAVEQGRQ